MTESQPAAGPSTVERILDAAGAVFAEEGYGGARVEAIAARAGVNKAMLYYHVGDKQELYAAVLSRNFQRAHRRLAAATASPGSVRERLHGVILALAELVEEIPHHPRIMLREIAGGAAHLGDGVVTQMLEILGVIQTLIAEGVKTGDLRASNPLLTHLLILGAVTFMTATRPVRGRLQQVVPSLPNPESPSQLADFLAEVLLYGIAAPGDAR